MTPTRLHTPMAAQLTPLDHDTAPPTFRELMGTPQPPWRDALGWTLLGMALTALLMAGAVYGVLEHVSGYWRGW